MALVISRRLLHEAQKIENREPAFLFSDNLRVIHVVPMSFKEEAEALFKEAGANFRISAFKSAELEAMISLPRASKGKPLVVWRACYG